MSMRATEFIEVRDLDRWASMLDQAAGLLERESRARKAAEAKKEAAT